MNSQEIHRHIAEVAETAKSAAETGDKDELYSVILVGIMNLIGECAIQLATMNERKRKEVEDKTSSRKTPGHREQRTVMRKTSTTMYFRPSSWNIECPLDDLRQFMPNPDQPELQDLELEDGKNISIGRLGSKDNVEVKRIR